MIHPFLANKTAADVLANRFEIVYLFDVTQGNPNGDPDFDNAPRVDAETGHGLITDVCLKRKVRNYVRLAKGDAAPYDIYVKERGILANEQRGAYHALGLNEGSDKANLDARAWMCKNFYDVRTFGAVMSTGKAPAEDDSGKNGGAKGKPPKAKQWNCGQVRGPIQFSFSRSIDPIFSSAHTITRVALTNAGDTDREAVVSEDGEEQASTGQMGRKHTVAYGLYRAHIFASPFLARDTKFTHEDFNLLLESLTHLFEHDRSASRGEMNSRGLFVFEHASELGNAHAHELFDSVKVKRNTNPPRSICHYDISGPSDGDEVAPGVRCWQVL